MIDGLTQCGKLIARVNELLLAWLPNDETPSELHTAMRYVNENGGKRIRALLVYLLTDALGGTMEAADAPAVAIEYIHAYSLVHDDLPAMDDDAMRRGKPSCHVAFDEATAILVGDACQTLAFECLAKRGSDLSAATRLLMVTCLSELAGARGLIGGQMRDLAATKKTLALPGIQRIHAGKTGAMFRACGEMALLAASVNDASKANHVRSFCESLGLAFQIQDDILDASSSSETLGKTAGKDAKSHKATYVTLLGIDEAQQLAKKTWSRVTESLAHIVTTPHELTGLVDSLQKRRY